MCLRRCGEKQSRICDCSEWDLTVEVQNNEFRGSI